MIFKSPFHVVLLVVLSLSFVASEVTVLKVAQTLYDQSPKLRIRGSGFNAADGSIILTLHCSGQPTLRNDLDYLVDTDNDGIILKLLSNRRWCDVTGHNLPLSLILSAVYFTSSSANNQLQQPVSIANVLNTPNVTGSDQIITQSSNTLVINGFGWIGAKKVDLYFVPQIMKEVAYEDVTHYPLVSDQVTLRLRHNYNWRDDEGPLKIVGVDTGGGPVKLNGDEGVKVANIISSSALTYIPVDSTVGTQRIYNDDLYVTITGSGFNSIGNTLRFANGILGNNVNYTTLSTTSTNIKLRLSPDSFWRKSTEKLPWALTLLAINAGEGFVPVVSSTMDKGSIGSDIAMVFDRPTIQYNNVQSLWRSRSPALHIKGSGFHLTMSFRPQLTFYPPLTEWTDYSLIVVNQMELIVSLREGRVWRATTGSLQITRINTRNDETGWISFNPAIQVAHIVEDGGAIHNPTLRPSARPVKQPSSAPHVYVPTYRPTYTPRSTRPTLKPTPAPRSTRPTLKPTPAPSTNFLVDANNFNRFIVENNWVFMEFYASPSAASQLFWSTWDAIAVKYRYEYPGASMVFAHIDCDNVINNAICGDEKLPLLRLYHWANKLIDYTGKDKSVDAIVAFVYDQQNKPTAINPQKSTNSKSLSVVSIVLIVLSVILLLVIGGGVLYYWRNKSHNQSSFGSNYELVEGFELPVRMIAPFAVSE